MRKSPKSAVIYARLSRDHSGEGLAVARQEEECRQFCDRQGWEVVEVFRDNDMSATSGVRREGFEGLLKAMSEGLGDVIVAWHQDRLLRLSKDLERVIALDVPIHTVTGGTFDLTTPAGRAVAKTVAAWSQYETEQKALRQKSANRQKAASGKRFVGGSRIFGWAENRTSLEIVEADAVRDATRSIIAGKALNSIANEWNANPGFDPPRGGKRWTAASIRSILLRESNAGIVVSQGERLLGVIGDWEPIVSTDEFEACAAVLRNPSRKKSTSTRLKHFISGLAHCGVCGARLRVATASVRRRGKVEKSLVFRCPQDERHGSRAMNPISQAVEEAIIQRLSAEDASDLFDPPPTGKKQAKALADIERIRSRLVDAEKDYANSDMTGAEFRSITRILNEQLREAQLLASDPLVARVPDRVRRIKPDQVRSVWESLSPPERRRVAEALLAVIVYPRSDPQFGSLPYGARIEWK